MGDYKKWRARKVGGSYEATGTVIGEGVTSLGKKLLMFEFDGYAGMIHVFGETQLERIKDDE